MRFIIVALALMAMFSTASVQPTCELFGTGCVDAKMVDKDDMAGITCPDGNCSTYLCCDKPAVEGPTDKCWDNPAFGDVFGITCDMYIDNGFCKGCSLDTYPSVDDMTDENKEDVLKNCCYGCECANREEDSCSPCFSNVQPFCTDIILNHASAFLTLPEDISCKITDSKDCANYFLDQCWNERSDCNMQQCLDRCEHHYGTSRNKNKCRWACEGGVINAVQQPEWNRKYRYCPVDPDTFSLCEEDCDKDPHCLFGCEHWNDDVPSISACEKSIIPEVLTNDCHCGRLRTTCGVGQWCIGGVCRNSQCGASQLRNRQIQCDPATGTKNWTKQIMKTCDANVCGLYVHLDQNCSNLYFLKKYRVRGGGFKCDCKCYKFSHGGKDLLCLVKSSITPIPSNVQYYQAIEGDQEGMNLACAGEGFKCDQKEGSDRDACYTECVQFIMKNDVFKNSEPFCSMSNKYIIAAQETQCPEDYRIITTVEECKAAVRFLGLEDTYEIKINEENDGGWNKCYICQKNCGKTGRVILDVPFYGDGRKDLCAKKDNSPPPPPPSGSITNPGPPPLPSGSITTLTMSGLPPPSPPPCFNGVWNPATNLWDC